MLVKNASVYEENQKDFLRGRLREKWENITITGTFSSILFSDILELIVENKRHIKENWLLKCFGKELNWLLKHWSVKKKSSI